MIFAFMLAPENFAERNRRKRAKKFRLPPAGLAPVKIIHPRPAKVSCAFLAPPQK
jgi:hypothetical protein